MSYLKKRDCLKHFYSYLDGRPTTWGTGKKRGAPKFFGVVVGYNHCRTIPPSLLTGTLPVPLFTPRVLSPSFDVAFSFFHRREPLLLPSYFVSRHCPFQSPWDCGANTAGYRINFLSRGCRDFTLLERRRWGGPQSETFMAAPLSGVGTSAWCRGRDEGEIKPRRKLK